MLLLPQISYHFFNTYLSVSCFSGFYNFNPKATFIRLEDFYFLVERVILGTPKSEATSLWKVPFSGSLRALNLIFQDLSGYWCFAAEMGTMYDV